MILNVLFLYYKDTIYNKKVINKIFIIGFMFYFLSLFLFKNIILLIAIFDSVYFIFNYIDIVTKSKKDTNNSRKYIVNSDVSKKKEKIVVHKLMQKMNDIDKATSVIKEIIIDPEFHKDKFKPYKYQLSDTAYQVIQNILT